MIPASAVTRQGSKYRLRGTWPCALCGTFVATRHRQPRSGTAAARVPRAKAKGNITNQWSNAKVASGSPSRVSEFIINLLSVHSKRTLQALSFLIFSYSYFSPPCTNVWVLRFHRLAENLLPVVVSDCWFLNFSYLIRASGWIRTERIFKLVRGTGRRPCIQPVPVSLQPNYIFLTIQNVNHDNSGINNPIWMILQLTCT